MKKLLALLASLALAACSAPAPKPVADADPALWVLKDDDTTIYLFGTVHALKPGLTWFDEAVKAAFDKSDTLVLELVMPPEAELQALIQELGTSKDMPLSQRLGDAEALRLRETLRMQGLPTNAMEGLEPWLAAVHLANIPARRAGYDPKDGAEAVLTAAAMAAGKPVIGLETARQQFGYFDTLPDKSQRRLLRVTLKRMPEGAKTLDAVVSHWSRGDADAIAELLNADMNGADDLADALLVTRNRKWADWIAARMKQPGTVFVAVGAGHLAGDRSVQAELAQRGFRVVRIRY